MDHPTPPEGFTVVSRARFFELLNEAGPRDPIPTTRDPNATLWKTQKGARETWGWTLPGWRSAYGTPRVYAVNDKFLATSGV